MSRYNILSQLKGHILEEDYNKYFLDVKTYIDFKYYLPFYTITQNKHILQYFVIDYCVEYDDLILSNIDFLLPANIKNITPEFCLKIYEYNYDFFLSVRKEEITYDFLKQIIGKNGNALKFLDKDVQTYELCKMAVTVSPQSHNYIKNLEHKTSEIYKIAIVTPHSCNGYTGYYAHSLIDLNIFSSQEKYDLWKNIISQSGYLIDVCNVRTEELCLIALNNDGSGFKYIENKTYEICKLAVSKSSINILKIDNKSFLTTEMYELAIKNDYNCLAWIDSELQTDDIIKIAIKTNIKSIFKIKDEEKRNYYIKENFYDVVCALVSEKIVSEKIMADSSCLKGAGGRL